jgi:hypothetical protein
VVLGGVAEIAAVAEIDPADGGHGSGHDFQRRIRVSWVTDLDCFDSGESVIR